MSKRSCPFGTTATSAKKHWSGGLLDAMRDPELKVAEHERVVVIKDKYPKAKFHYLILPREDVSSLKRVTKEHLGLLEHMDEVGRKLVEDKHQGVQFRLGYHAEASMARLHLHVISDDMVSDCLKTKKHWNSFTTEFFLRSLDVCKFVKENDHANILSPVRCKELMNAPLKCHKCDHTPKNMPALKKHILEHL